MQTRDYGFFPLILSWRLLYAREEHVCHSQPWRCPANISVRFSCLANTHCRLRLSKECADLNLLNCLPKALIIRPNQSYSWSCPPVGRGAVNLICNHPTKLPLIFPSCFKIHLPLILPTLAVNCFTRNLTVILDMEQ